jgi:hypothetical protein
MSYRMPGVGARVCAPSLRPEIQAYAHRCTGYAVMLKSGPEAGSVHVKGSLIIAPGKFTGA